MNLKARIRSIIAEKRAEFRDIFGACIDLLKWGKECALSAHRSIEAFIGRLLEKPDPARFAKKPPTWWNEATPEADVPPRKTTAKEVDLNAWTDEELVSMSESEYRAKVGLIGVQAYEEAIKQAKKRISRKGNAKEI